MSGSGGKLTLLKEQARQAVATAPGRRLDEMTQALEALPDRFQHAADMSAGSLKESLVPMVEQVSSLRTSLEHLPTLLAQQTDGVLSQIQSEGQAFRVEIGRLKTGLASLPDALAQQVAPIVLMAERLDQVLDLQRSSLAALHEESMRAFKAALVPTTERVDSGVRALVKQGHQTASVLQGMQGLPQEIRQAAEQARAAGTETAQAIRQARGSQWHPMAQALVTAVVVAGLILGGLTWLGTPNLSRLLLPSGLSAKEQAWDNLYQQVPPWRPTMDGFLANSVKR